MADNPGAQEGGGLHHPCLDYTGKLAGRPAATGFTGPGPVEGTHSISVLSVFFFHSILFKIISELLPRIFVFVKKQYFHVTSYFYG